MLSIGWVNKSRESQASHLHVATQVCEKSDDTNQIFFFTYEIAARFDYLNLHQTYSCDKQETINKMADNSEQPKCPVDHSARTSWFWKSKQEPTKEIPQDTPSSPSSCPVDHTSIPKQTPNTDQPTCPVDHSTRSAWIKNVSVSVDTPVEAIEVPAVSSSEPGCDSTSINNTLQDTTTTNVDLPTEREISSIPRTRSNTNWIYPSQKQFYEAMKRKNWNPDSDDMQTVVPIHNNVNERTWRHIMMWEQENQREAMEKCGGITLTSFKGNLKKLTPRAWVKSILGQEKPFDRHDWVIDRCGTRVEYVIDFYGSSSEGGVFLDVRPKIQTWEGLKLRIGKALGWN